MAVVAEAAVVCSRYDTGPCGGADASGEAGRDGEIYLVRVVA